MAEYSRSHAPPSQHPLLNAPKLYISQLAPDVSEADLARAFESCVPVRPQIHLDPETNTKRGKLVYSSLSCTR